MSAADGIHRKLLRCAAADTFTAMTITLYNTLTRRTEPFAPLDPARVTMYLCGPTVYNYVHIGNARGPVVFDVLTRLLRRHYPKVVFARNITDVDDKINAAASREGVSIGTISERFAGAYHEDMQRLDVAPPDIEPHATQHMAEMIAMIENLIARGHAYVAENHVLFDVASWPEYGQLSGRSIEDMLAGARVEVEAYKKHPGDFVLWKPSSDDLPGWDSPWGRGRPGWHIECSAMSAAHLGETIDIHAGGVDLTFPHHENEIAQSTCAHGGKTFARWWLHNGMLTFGGAKMSKSLGNVMELHALLQEHPPEALRLLLLRAHYRQPLDWSEDALKQAIRTLDGWYGVLRDMSDVAVDAAATAIPEMLEAALCDDLNTPQALAELSHLADQARQADNPKDRAAAKSALLAGGRALGLLQQAPDAWFRRNAGDIDTNTVEALIEERRQARADKNWARADAIRDELAAMGVSIEDGAQGTRWSTSRSD